MNPGDIYSAMHGQGPCRRALAGIRVDHLRRVDEGRRVVPGPMIMMIGAGDRRRRARGTVSTL